MGMQYLVFEFENETELRQTVDNLWKKIGVSGEVSIRPLASGRWRLEINAEKELRDSTLEKIAPNRVETGD